MKELFHLRTNGILDKVCLSKKQRPSPLFLPKNKHFPDKYFDKNKYEFRNVSREGVSGYWVWDRQKEEYVMTNPRSAGTPKYISVNTQRIYAGVHFSVRARVVDELHQWFREQILQQKRQTIQQFPIFLSLTISKYEKTKCADIDNASYIYIKCFMDTIKDMGIIPEDSPDYFRGYSVNLVFVDRPSLECLVFSIKPYH